MSLLLAAVGATVTAVLEVTLAGYVRVGNAYPHFTLVLGIAWTIAAGLDSGLAWAFVGGLVLDALLGRPVGASAFSLLLAVGAAHAIAQLLRRVRLIAPVLAVPFLSLAYSVLLLVLASGAQVTSNVVDPVSAFVPAAVYDTVLAIFLGPLLVSVHDRQLTVERAEW